MGDRKGRDRGPYVIQTALSTPKLPSGLGVKCTFADSGDEIVIFSEASACQRQFLITRLHELTGEGPAVPLVTLAREGQMIKGMVCLFHFITAAPQKSQVSFNTVLLSSFLILLRRGG